MRSGVGGVSPMGTVSSTALPLEATGVLHRRGLSDRGERWLNLSAGAVVALFAIGWTWSLVNARDIAAARAESGDVSVGPAGRVAAALTKADAPTTAYLT